MKITLTGQPLSTSHCYQHTCRGGFATVFMVADCKFLKADYAAQARAQYQDEPMTDELRVQVILYHGTRHKRDIDNYNKLITRRTLRRSLRRR